MANFLKRNRENVPGAYFVDDQCIDCDMCRQSAPTIFTRKNIGNTGYSVVYHQPSSPAEEALCVEAMDACPVNAIGRQKGAPVHETRELAYS